MSSLKKQKSILYTTIAVTFIICLKKILVSPIFFFELCYLFTYLFDKWISFKKIYHWSMEKTLKNALCYSKELSPVNGLECQAYVKILIHQQWQLLHISEKFSKRTKKITQTNKPPQCASFWLWPALAPSWRWPVTSRSCASPREAPSAPHGRASHRPTPVTRLTPPPPAPEPWSPLQAMGKYEWLIIDLTSEIILYIKLCIENPNVQSFGNLNLNHMINITSHGPV